MKKLVLLFALFTITFTACAKKVAVTQPVEKVVVIQKPPKNHRVVYVKGKRYYKWDGNHYRKSRRGYVRVKVRTL